MLYDLRKFLDELAKHGELVEIKKRVDPEYQAATLMKQMDDQGGPAILFKSMKGYEIPVVGNLLSSMRRMGIALGCSPPEIRDKLSYAIANPLKPVIVDNGPVKEVVITDTKKIDLLKMFPILTHAEADAGPYITAGIFTAKDPETGRRNASYNRLMIKGPSKIGLAINIWRHLREFHDKAEAKNEPLDVSISIGVDPAIEIATGLKVPFDELEVAGALRNEPVRLVPGETVKVEAIADAEIVLEGRLRPNVRESEGPFGEFTGHYGHKWEYPVLDITAVLMRSKPIYRGLLGGGFEHVVLGNVVTREPSLYDMVKRIVPTTKNVHIAPYGGGFLVAIQMEKRNEGEPQNAIMAAFTSHVNIKYVIVVDPDVDIYNPRDLWWAVSTRTNGKQDFLFIPGALGHEMDPSTQPDGTTTKMGIDATVPVGELNTKYRRISFKNMDKWRLQDFL
ncbi:MAG: UbiD family decarboxylase [Candidatus Ranarchaeia archaeon]